MGHVIQSLIEYFTPVRIMRDASRGTPAERLAAYRHNCSVRNCLPTFISRWILGLVVAVLASVLFDAQAPQGSGITVFVVLAAAAALFATLAACAVFILAYAYAVLSYNARH